MKTNNTRARPRNISLYPVDERIIEEIQARHGLSNASAAVRFTLRSFAREQAWELSEVQSKGGSE